MDRLVEGWKSRLTQVKNNGLDMDKNFVCTFVCMMGKEMGRYKCMDMDKDYVVGSTP